jgi:hypothetical protein
MTTMYLYEAQNTFQPAVLLVYSPHVFTEPLDCQIIIIADLVGLQ